MQCHVPRQEAAGSGADPAPPGGGHSYPASSRQTRTPPRQQGWPRQQRELDLSTAFPWGGQTPVRSAGQSHRHQRERPGTQDGHAIDANDRQAATRGRVQPVERGQLHPGPRSRQDQCGHEEGPGEPAEHAVVSCQGLEGAAGVAAPGLAGFSGIVRQGAEARACGLTATAASSAATRSPPKEKPKSIDDLGFRGSAAFAERCIGGAGGN